VAVCGRCLICGHKFNGDTTPDVGVRWACACSNEHCTKQRLHFEKVYEEVRTHAICASCIEHLADGVTLPAAVADLMALVTRRRDD
jgi:hypothetical protein